MKTKTSIKNLLFKEDINIPIKIGDHVKGGRFLNKDIEVKTIGKDDKNQPTINGKKLLKFRIPKLMNKTENKMITIKEIVLNEIKLKEESLSLIKKNIQIVFDLKSTEHSVERKDREGYEYISDDEIIHLVNNSLETLSRDMVLNRLNIGDTVVLKGKRNLNIVGKLKRSGEIIEFIIITIMKIKDFKIFSGNVVYNIES